jgi:hypothetical protein
MLVWPILQSALNDIVTYITGHYDIIVIFCLARFICVVLKFCFVSCQYYKRSRLMCENGSELNALAAARQVMMSSNSSFNLFCVYN